MDVIFRPIPTFPAYSISAQGEVRNDRSGRILRNSKNQGGIVKVCIMYDAIPHVRSVAKLVAETWIDDRPEHFTTPIHLDGDRSNCHVSNLVYRPLWFARDYHQQMATDWFTTWTRLFIAVETQDLFSNPRECAMAYGVLPREVPLALWNRVRIFPVRYMLEFVD